MKALKRVYVGVPREHNLDDRQRVLKHAILEKMRAAGLEPQELRLLQELGLLETWHESEHRRRRETVVEWCRENGLELDDE